jgi:hypothetical protein
MKAIEKQQLTDKIATLWLGGVTSERQIAKALGVDRGVVRRTLALLKREWAEQHAAGREDNRAVALARLDRLQTAFSSAASSGDPQAANVLLKIEERRAALHGTDAPARVDARLQASVSVGLPSIDDLVLRAHEDAKEQEAQVRELIERTASGSRERALVLETVAILKGPAFLHVEEPRQLTAPDGL